MFTQRAKIQQAEGEHKSVVWKKNTGAEEVLMITPESRQDLVRDGGIRGRDI